jgi:hypothetical protein
VSLSSDCATPWSLIRGVFQRMCVCVRARVCCATARLGGGAAKGGVGCRGRVVCLACGVDCATFVLSVLRKTKSRSPTPGANIPSSQHSHSSPR